MSTQLAEAYLDTENLFHGLRPERRPSHAALASLKSLLPREAVRRPGPSGTLFRTLRDLLDWQRARSGIEPNAARSYGKTVDRAVRLLWEESREIGLDYAETDRGQTADPRHITRPLIDFRTEIDLGLAHPVPLVHVDVPAGRDEAELRLIADLQAARRDGTLPDSCLLASGDNKILTYVDRLPRELRGRMLVAIPPGAAAMRAKVGTVYARIDPENVALIAEVRILAAKERQRPGGAPASRPSHPRRLSTAAPQPTRAEVLVAALVAVDWRAVRAARYGSAEWLVATGSLEIAQAVERSLLDAAFVARFDSPPARRPMVSSLLDATIDPAHVQWLVTSAVLYDAIRRGESTRAAVRRAIGGVAAHGFLRDALMRVQPLLPLTDPVHVP